MASLPYLAEQSPTSGWRQPGPAGDGRRRTRICPPGPLRRISGATAIALWLVHAAYHVHCGQPEALLWTCNVSLLVLAVGLVANRPPLAAMGLLSLVGGLPLWVYASLARGEWLPTSVMAHLGGVVCGAIALALWGLPRGTWLRTVPLVVVVLVASWVVAPPEANVNLVYGMSLNSSGQRPSGAVPTILALILLWTAQLWLLEAAIARLARWQTWRHLIMRGFKSAAAADRAGRA